MRAAAAIVAAILLSGCATLAPSTETFRIDSDPPGATATLSTGQICSTPCTLTLPRADGFFVTVEKEGYLSNRTVVRSSPSASEHHPLDGVVLGSWFSRMFVAVPVGSVRTAAKPRRSLHPNPLLVQLEPE